MGTCRNTVRTPGWSAVWPGSRNSSPACSPRSGTSPQGGRAQPAADRPGAGDPGPRHLPQARRRAKAGVGRGNSQTAAGQEELDRVLAGRLLREYRTEQETLLREMAFLARIAELTEHRAKLADGAPCPLCGATEHPFAAGNVPVPDAMEQKITALGELIRRAEDQEAAIKTLETAEALARNQLAAGEIRRQRPRAARAPSRPWPRCRQAWRLSGPSPAHAAGGPGATPAPGHHGHPGNRDSRPAGNPQGATAGLAGPGATQGRDRKTAGRHRQRVQTAGRGSRNPRQCADRKAGSPGEHARERAERSAERQALYGDRNPDTEEERLRTAVTEAENAENRPGQSTARQQHWRTAQAQVALRHKSIDQREPELQQVTAEFLAALPPARLADEAEFLAARSCRSSGGRTLAARPGRWMRAGPTSRPGTRIGTPVWPWSWPRRSRTNPWTS